jgi:GNAT superfamily N-acetyltransferase
MEFKPISLDLLDEVTEVEHESFPADEAASKETISIRMRLAPQYFYGAFENGQLIGFMNGTVTNGSVLLKDDFYKHDVDGKMLIIHGVVTRKEHRRKGVASEMLKRYLEMVKKQKNIDTIALLSKERLTHFYSRFGFRTVRLSEVRLGAEQWHEMQTQNQVSRERSHLSLRP